MTLSSLLLSLVLAGACGGTSPEGDPAAPSASPTPPADAQLEALSLEPPPPVPEQHGIALARRPERIRSLQLPESSREEPPGPSVTIDGPFKRVRASKGWVTWEAPIPIRPRNLFFESAPPGMRVEREGERVAFRNGTRDARAGWDFTAQTVLLRRAADEGKPSAGEYTLVYDKAQEREASLNRDSAGMEDMDFVLRSLQWGEDTKTGVFLPAPGQVSWEIQLMEGAVLSLEGALLPPEQISGEGSDGASLRVGWRGDSADEVTWLEERPLSSDSWEVMRWDLSAWAGQSGALILETLPGESALLDYVFLAEPLVHAPQSDPPRLLMIFIDTLRPDHMSLYGYERETTPRLDAWAEDAIVFENARSVAPWTLPSTRTALSGFQPEDWRKEARLQEALAQAGWVTAAFVGNVYLSSNFEMAEGWSHHSCVNWPVAEVQVDKVRAFLDDHADRPAAVMLHVMDMHLPYTEPLSYRTLWADKVPPAGLSPRALRRSILNAYKKKSQRQAVEDYIVARYDQNLRYLDDQLMDLMEELGSDTRVVLFADHGEEFWDHDGFEHGHSLYDELLRVPLIVKSPGMQGQRVVEPVSLLDVTPTALELAELSPSGRQGLSLLGISSDQGPELLSELRARGQVFGRPLYGSERWGVLLEDQKWTTHQGRERVALLDEDPREQDLDPAEERDRLQAVSVIQQALGREAPLVWRIQPEYAEHAQEELRLYVSHPEGFVDAWMGEDPLRKSSMIMEDEAGERVIVFKKGFRGYREIYFQPAPGASLKDLTLQLGQGTGERGSAHSPRSHPAEGSGKVALTFKEHGRRFKVSLSRAPKPGEGEAVQAVDAESLDALKALGYLE